MPGHGQAGTGSEHHRCRRPDDRDDLEDPGRDAEQEPVRLADEHERHRGQGANEGDHHDLAPDERAELLVDELPGVPQLLAPGAGHEAGHEIDRPVALEQPVGSGGQSEQDGDQDPHRLGAGRESGVDQLVGSREVMEAYLERIQDPVFDAAVLRHMRVRSESHLNLGDHPGHHEGASIRPNTPSSAR